MFILAKRFLCWFASSDSQQLACIACRFCFNWTVP